MRLGIAITTYNRRDMVVSLCASLRLFTTTPFDLVICDDGSTDGTAETLKSVGEIVIGGRNGGIARNKNRGIWFLLHRCQVDYLLLLDDDTYPTKIGWEREWIEALTRWKHVNHLVEIYRDKVVSGAGTAADPGNSTHLSGSVLAFERNLLSTIGFMDPRFGRYGHEHAEFTSRALRAGYGGHDNGRGHVTYLVIDGNIRLHGVISNGSPEDAKKSAAIWGDIAHEQIYRHAWRDDTERTAFLIETQPL